LKQLKILLNRKNINGLVSIILFLFALTMLMKKIKSHIILRYLILAFILLEFPSCFKNLTVQNLVYFNDFETGQYNGIELSRFYLSTDTPKVFVFNGSKVLGGFNNGAFSVSLGHLPEHNAINVEFDLYIHGPWQGDYLGTSNIPDLWKILIDDKNVLLTTFSNTSYKQSYPSYYLSGPEYPARGDAYITAIPGRCSTANQPDGSSWYKFVTTIPHTQDSTTIYCADALQPYNSGCIKSWSIDNLKITAIKY